VIQTKEITDMTTELKYQDIIEKTIGALFEVKMVWIRG